MWGNSLNNRGGLAMAEMLEDKMRAIKFEILNRECKYVMEKM